MKVNIVRSTGPCLAQMIQPPSDYDGMHLLRFIRSSTICWSAQVDDVGVCIWGLMQPTLLSEHAYLWLWTTELAVQYQFLLVRYSQRMIETMLKEYPVIVGHCNMDDSRAQRWLKWLGAEFSFPEKGLIPFVIRRK